jgi:hypothetical protein
MEPIRKLLGEQCQIANAGTTTVKEGYRAYAAMVRVDNTQILSVTKVERDDGTIEEITDESWENINLLAGIDYVSFEDAITSITLSTGTSSVMLFLEKI